MRFETPVQVLASEGGAMKCITMSYVCNQYVITYTVDEDAYMMIHTYIYIYIYELNSLHFVSSATEDLQLVFSWVTRINTTTIKFHLWKTCLSGRARCLQVSFKKWPQSVFLVKVRTLDGTFLLLCIGRAKPQQTR